MLRKYLLLLGVLLPLGGSAETLLNCGNATLHFRSSDGALIRIVSDRGVELPVSSSRDGLFLAIGKNRKQFHPLNAQPSLREEKGKFTVTYCKNDAVFTVTATAGKDYVDFQTEVRNGSNTVIESVSIPGKLEFSPDRVRRVVMPDGGLKGVGFAFLPDFFREQSVTDPVAWTGRCTSPASYIKLFGGPLNSLSFLTPPVALKVTPEGEKIFSPELTAALNKMSRKVCRASAEGQYQVSLIDSANGPFFSGSDLGGKGCFWRFGGSQYFNDTRPEAGINIFTEIVSAVIRHQREKPADRNIIVLFVMKNGPLSGPMAQTKVTDWEKVLRKAAGASGCSFEIAYSAQDVLKSLNDPAVLALVNPYGEAFPMTADGPGKMLEAMRRFVQSGGNWFETGGYSFHWEYTPTRFLSYQTEYPSTAADFLQIDGRKGFGFGLYSVQKLSGKAWDRDSLLYSAVLSCGGGKRKGWVNYDFKTCIKPGESWTSPVVRMRFGTPEQNLQAYCADNGLVRRLPEKMEAEKLQLLKESVFFLAQGKFDYLEPIIPYLPVPTVLHCASFLRNGFDRSYPDHLPFCTGWENLPRAVKELQRRGHFFMPYTNSSFWCETKPRPPTFAKVGDAGLLRKEDGKFNVETYGWSDNRNVGYTLCMWHPLIQNANRETVRQFTEDFPVDILFQDQFGVRWQIPDFNPASPSIAAGYVTGIINQVSEDAGRIPVATEGGYAHLTNAESLFFGFGLGLIPTRNRGSGQLDYHAVYPRKYWRLFPVIQYVAHDKVILNNHNGVAFIQNDETLAWWLGMGFSLSYLPQKWGMYRVKEPAEQSILNFLSIVQKQVVAPGIGEPLRNFRHSRRNETDNGVIRAQYGPVSVTANLGSIPIVEPNGITIAPFGYRASSEKMRAGTLHSEGSLTRFVAYEQDGAIHLAVCGTPGQVCTVLLPHPVSTEPVIHWKNGETTAVQVKNRDQLIFRLPAAQAQEKMLFEGVLK